MIVKDSPLYSEKALLAKLKLGDRNAFELIYRKFAKDIYRYCANSIKEREECEEIVQDVFVSLWERREQLELDSLKAYLFISVKYKVIRYIKHLAVKQEFEEHYRFFESTYELPVDPDRVHNTAPLHVHLSQFLKDLPANYSEALRLRLEQNLTNSEIAQRLHVSKRTVEDYISTAYAHLRKFKQEILGAE